MSLQADLDAFKASFVDKVPEDVREAMGRADRQLALSFHNRPRLGPGSQAPDFSLERADGQTVRLSDRLSQGPVVLTFYRGGWCPYCNLELRAYQQLLPEIERAGGTLIAVSPQTPDASLTTQEKNELTFDVLTDIGSDVAEAYGIVFELSPELREVYTGLGHPLPGFNETDDWRLPVPATFVIDASGSILLSHIETDYRQRLEPQDAVTALRLLSEPSAA